MVNRSTFVFVVLLARFVPDVQCQSPYVPGNAYGSGSGVGGGAVFRAGSGRVAAGVGTVVSRRSGTLGNRYLPPGTRSTATYGSGGSNRIRSLQHRQQTHHVPITRRPTGANTRNTGLRYLQPSRGISPSVRHTKPRLSPTEVEQMRQLVRHIPSPDAQKMRKIYSELGNSQPFRDLYNSYVLELRAKASLSGTPSVTLPLWPKANENAAGSVGGRASTGRGVVTGRGVASPNRDVTGLQLPTGTAQARSSSLSSRNTLTSLTAPVHQNPPSSLQPSSYSLNRAQPPQRTLGRSSSTLSLSSLQSSSRIDRLEPWRPQARRLPLEVQKRLKKLYDITGDTPSFRTALNKSLAKYLTGAQAVPLAGTASALRINQGLQQQQQRFPQQNGVNNIQQLQQQRLQEQKRRKQQQQRQALTGLMLASSLQGNGHSDDESSRSKAGPLMASYLMAGSLARGSLSRHPAGRHPSVPQNVQTSGTSQRRILPSSLSHNSPSYVTRGRNANLNASPVYQHTAAVQLKDAVPRRVVPLVQSAPQPTSSSTKLPVGVARIITVPRGPSVSIQPQNSHLSVQPNGTKIIIQPPVSGPQYVPLVMPPEASSRVPNTNSQSSYVAPNNQVAVQGNHTNPNLPSLVSVPVSPSAAPVAAPSAAFPASAGSTVISSPTIIIVPTSSTVMSAPLVPKIQHPQTRAPATNPPVPATRSATNPPPTLPTLSQTSTYKAVSVNASPSLTIESQSNSATSGVHTPSVNTPPASTVQEIHPTTVAEALATQPPPGLMGDAEILSRMPSHVANNATLRQMFISMATLARERAQAARAELERSKTGNNSIPGNTASPSGVPSPFVIVVPPQMMSGGGDVTALTSLLSGNPNMLSALRKIVPGFSVPGLSSQNSSVGTGTKQSSPVTTTSPSTTAPTTTTETPTTTTPPKKISLEPAITFSMSLPESSIHNVRSPGMRSLLQPMISATIGKAETHKSKIEQFKTALYDILTSDSNSYVIVSNSNRNQIHYKRDDDGPTILVEELLPGYLTGNVDMTSLSASLPSGLIPVLQFDWMFDEGSVPTTATEAVDLVLAKYGRKSTTTTTTTTTSHAPSTTMKSGPPFEIQRRQTSEKDTPMMNIPPPGPHDATYKLIEILKGLSKPKPSVIQSPNLPPKIVTDVKTTLEPLTGNSTPYVLQDTSPGSSVVTKSTFVVGLNTQPPRVTRTNTDHIQSSVPVSEISLFTPAVSVPMVTSSPVKDLAPKDVTHHTVKTVTNATPSLSRVSQERQQVVTPGVPVLTRKASHSSVISPTAASPVVNSSPAAQEVIDPKTTPSIPASLPVKPSPLDQLFGLTPSSSPQTSWSSFSPFTPSASYAGALGVGGLGVGGIGQFWNLIPHGNSPKPTSSSKPVEHTGPTAGPSIVTEASNEGNQTPSGSVVKSHNTPSLVRPGLSGHVTMPLPMHPVTSVVPSSVVHTPLPSQAPVLNHQELNLSTSPNSDDLSTHSADLHSTQQPDASSSIAKKTNGQDSSSSVPSNQPVPGVRFTLPVETTPVKTHHVTMSTTQQHKPQLSPRPTPELLSTVSVVQTHHQPSPPGFGTGREAQVPSGHHSTAVSGAGQLTTSTGFNTMPHGGGQTIGQNGHENKAYVIPSTQSPQLSNAPLKPITHIIPNAQSPALNNAPLKPNSHTIPDAQAPELTNGPLKPTSHLIHNAQVPQLTSGPLRPNSYVTPGGQAPGLTNVPLKPTSHIIPNAPSPALTNAPLKPNSHVIHNAQSPALANAPLKPNSHVIHNAQSPALANAPLKPNSNVIPNVQDPGLTNDPQSPISYIIPNAQDPGLTNTPLKPNSHIPPNTQAPALTNAPLNPNSHVIPNVHFSVPVNSQSNPNPNPHPASNNLPPVNPPMVNPQGILNDVMTPNSYPSSINPAGQGIGTQHLFNSPNPRPQPSAINPAGQGIGTQHLFNSPNPRPQPSPINPAGQGIGTQHLFNSQNLQLQPSTNNVAGRIPGSPPAVNSNAISSAGVQPAAVPQNPVTPAPNFDNMDYFRFLEWLEYNFPSTTPLPPSPPPTTTPIPITLPPVCPANQAVKCGPVRKSNRMAALCEIKCDVTTATCDLSVCRCSCVATVAQLSLQLAPKRTTTTTTTTLTPRVMTTKKTVVQTKEEEESD